MAAAGGVRALAGTVAATAQEVRALAARAEAGAAAGWRSTSAEAFRERLAGEVAAVRSAADRLDDAAAQLRAYATAVEVLPW